MLAERPGSVERPGDIVLARGIERPVPNQERELEKKPRDKRFIFPKLAAILDHLEWMRKNGADMPGASDVVLTTADIRDVSLRMVFAVSYWVGLSFLLMFALPILIITLFGAINKAYTIAYMSSVAGSMIILMHGWLIYKAQANVLGPTTDKYWQQVVGTWHSYEWAVWGGALFLALMLWAFSSKLDGLDYGHYLGNAFRNICSWIADIFGNPDTGARFAEKVRGAINKVTGDKSFVLIPLRWHMISMIFLCGGLYYLTAQSARAQARKEKASFAESRDNRLDVDLFSQAQRILKKLDETYVRD
jgi:hypothetical protein